LIYGVRATYNENIFIYESKLSELHDEELSDMYCLQNSIKLLVVGTTKNGVKSRLQCSCGYLVGSILKVRKIVEFNMQECKIGILL